MRSRRWWAVVIAVLSVAAGVGLFGWYVIRNPAAPGCHPPSSPLCQGKANAADLRVVLPFSDAQTITQVPAYAVLPPGDIASQFVFDFGDGSAPNYTNAPTEDHTYASPGLYLISAGADISRTWHTNIDSLVALPIRASFASTGADEAPGVNGSVLSNSSTVTGVNPSAVLRVGETVTVSASYSYRPPDPNFTVRRPSLIEAPGATVEGSPVITGSSAAASVKFASAGDYWLRFVGSATNATGAVAFQNFTWTVYVAPPGVHAGLAPPAADRSTHPGRLVSDEYAPGGTNSIDPAINYDTTGAETLLNVDETLIQFNGSQVGPAPSSFVPVLAACVPGSALCSSTFGSSLLRGQNYTFVIDGGARFYDPATGASWGVYPTDVLFSFSRAFAFADLPCYTCNPGWILGQALLPSGNASWDAGAHVPINNTPSNVWASMTLNGSDCPELALSSPTYHGCITLRADGQGRAWPFFLELVAEEQVGEIVPCGWVSAATQSAGIPYWTYGNVSGSGDRPCSAPGTGGLGVPNPPPTAWDSYEVTGSQAPYWGNVEYSNVGSGPYALSAYSPGQGYSLAINPSYEAPRLCSGLGCWPVPGTFAKSVSVTYETTFTPGESSLAAGAVDFAGTPSTDTPLLISLIEGGKAHSASFPTLTIGAFAFNFAFDPTALSSFVSQPVNIPSDFLSHLAVRQFLERAYPYGSVDSSVSTVDGIHYGFDFGGGIPRYLSGYYPSNIPWPDANPCSDANDSACPGYWWTQGTTAGSPLYDAELSACTNARSCSIPVFILSGRQDLALIAQLWAASVASVSRGALNLLTVPVNQATFLTNALTGPDLSPMPIYGLGFVPDYPDPTDYLGTLYTPDASWMYTDGVREQATLPAFNQTSCRSWMDYTGWAAAGAALSIPDGCQGAALSAMAYVEGLAAIHAAGPIRAQLYDSTEQIAFGLGLYTYAFQFNLVLPYAPWIDGNSFNTNPMIGGGGDQFWFDVTGNGVA
ncbi:MAG TPA: hypothetical protein VFF67_00815 [Thermoplasmata archaeon]|nr:hypothetical protein [Thermoplasmata archaeon]